ncbi:MAG: hypothetical protein RR416_05710 [Clostridia bacterium]
MNKKILRWFILAFSIIMNVWGILSLLYTTGLVKVGFLSYLEPLRLILKYVVVVITMALGIMSFTTLFANMFQPKTRNILAIAGTAYSTILTIPLFLTFIGCFFAINGIEVPLAGDIARELQDIFKTTGMQYVIFTLGTIMGAVFLAVPILMTVLTVKGKPKKAVETSDAKD